MTYWGFNTPFIGGPGKVMSRQVDEKIIKNDLLQLLLTSPGERVMRPDFGTGIRQFTFENMTQASVDVLKGNILEAIATYEPRVSASDVVITQTPDNNFLDIKVYGNFNLDKYFNATAQGQQQGLLVELGIPLTQPQKQQVALNV